MIKRTGLIDYSVPVPEFHCVFFTSNQVVKGNGALVMGAGNAKAARDAIQGLQFAMGSQCLNSEDDALLFVQHGAGIIGAFPTKRHFKDPTPKDLLLSSIAQLKELALEKPMYYFHLPMPAVNHGGMAVEDVLPLVEQLPDNVYVYSQGW